MQTPSVSAISLKRTRAVFAFGVVLLFFTSMNKVLIPAAVFDPIQHDLSLDAATMAAMGAWNMAAYAISQFIFGILADRLGGTRILLTGGAAFCVGMLAFPFCPCNALLLPLRAITGFGAGIVFLGLAKLMADLFPQRFAYILGYTLVVGYLGTVTGQAPAVWLVAAIGWRQALTAITAIATVAFLGIITFAKGTISPMKRGVPVLRPALAIMLRPAMLRLCIASGITIGCYNALLNIMGRKCLEDMGAGGQSWPALFMTALVLLVVALNMLGGTFSRLSEGRFGLAMSLLTLTTLVAALAGWCALQFGWGNAILPLAFILISIPAGFFPLACSAAKSTLPPEQTALAFSLVNFWAALLIAIACNLAGWAMGRNEHLAAAVGNILRYPPAAYKDVFLVFLALGILAFMATLGLFPKKKTDA